MKPFSGLDPINMTLLKDLMLELNADGATIIFSTHIMEQAEKLCEKICLVNAGKIVLEGGFERDQKNPSAKVRWRLNILEMLT